jgi:hypothetical protein
MQLSYGCGWSLAMSFLAAGSLAAHESGDRAVEAIKDNSILVEEAYNQEPGIVHHLLLIGHHVHRMGSTDDREWQFAFTQEWPLASERHQIAYTLPYSILEDQSGSTSGLGDIALHYRFQAFSEQESSPAVAPRLSLILPTGSARRGLGEGRLGYQFNLPVSKTLSDRWAMHGNAGLTTFPGLRGRDPITPHLAGSLVYAPHRQLHLLLESVGAWTQTVDASAAVESAFECVLSPGARYAVNWGDSQLVLGVGIPIGITRSAPDFGVLLYLSWEHSFARPQE